MIIPMLLFTSREYQLPASSNPLTLRWVLDYCFFLSHPNAYSHNYELTPTNHLLSLAFPRGALSLPLSFSPTTQILQVSLRLISFFFPSSQFINSIFVTLIEKKNSISATNSPLPSVSGWWCSRRTRPAPTSPKQRTSMRRPITVFPFSAIELGNDGEGKIELRRGEEVTEKLDARYEANLGEKSPWKIKAWEHRSQAKQREMRQLPRQKADSSSKHPDQKRTQTINSSVVSPDRNWKLLKTTNYLFLLPG